MKKFNEYISNNEIIGDDFELDEITKWYNDESNAYSNLTAMSDYTYDYHALNSYHGFNRLPKGRKFSALGLGSAYGDEFLPVYEQLISLDILDPSDEFEANPLSFKCPLNYSKPSITGELPFESSSFNLITSFGVLHHIPNVSFVLSELFRVLDSGGYLLLREPIVSMGNWEHKRNGLTPRERGFPLNTFLEIIESSGFVIDYKALCFFRPSILFFSKLGFSYFNSDIFVRFDHIFSELFKFNYNYHTDSFLKKIKPTNLFCVLKK